jgi:hypothetical protein
MGSIIQYSRTPVSLVDSTSTKTLNILSTSTSTNITVRPVGTYSIIIITAPETRSFQVGNTEVALELPKGYTVEVNDTLFILPVVVFAQDQETIDEYLENASSVRKFIIIFTTFGKEDLTRFGLTKDADTNAIIDKLVRSDSELGEREAVAVAGMDTVAVTFTNPTTGKSGKFHLIQFGESYMLIQASAPTDQWEAIAPTYEAVIASMVTAAAEE